MSAHGRFLGPMGRLACDLDAAGGTPKRPRAAQERAKGDQEGPRQPQGRQKEAKSAQKTPQRAVKPRRCKTQKSLKNQCQIKSGK